MPRVNYVREAFGDFDPDQDKNAALKFALGFVMLDGQLESLVSLLSPGSRIGAIGGDPGWEIERRNPAPPTASAYTRWPGTAVFRAYIDPEGFRIQHPESFYDARTFTGYVWVVAAVYGRHNPERMPLIARLLNLLPGRPLAETAVVSGA